MQFCFKGSLQNKEKLFQEFINFKMQKLNGNQLSYHFLSANTTMTEQFKQLKHLGEWE